MQISHIYKNITQNLPFNVSYNLLMCVLSPFVSVPPPLVSVPPSIYFCPECEWLYSVQNRHLSSLIHPQHLLHPLLHLQDLPQPSHYLLQIPHSQQTLWCQVFSASKLFTVCHFLLSTARQSVTHCQLWIWKFNFFWKLSENPWQFVTLFTGITVTFSHRITAFAPCYPVSTLWMQLLCEQFWLSGNSDFPLPLPHPA